VIESTFFPVCDGSLRTGNDRAATKGQHAIIDGLEAQRQHVQQVVLVQSPRLAIPLFGKNG